MREAVRRGARKRAARRRRRAARSRSRRDGIAGTALPSRRHGGERDYVLPGNKEYRRRRQDRAAEGRPGRRPGKDGSTTARARTIFEFMLPRTNSRPLLRGSRTAGSGARRKLKDAEAMQLARAGYPIDRRAGQSQSAAHHAQLPGAAHRAEAAQPSEIDALEAEAEIAHAADDFEGAARRAQARSRRAQRRRASASPSSTRSTCATTASSASRSRSTRR